MPSLKSRSSRKLMSPKYKIVLLDVDGVLITPPQLFSRQYFEEYGVDPVQFFSTQEFQDSSLGKFDLKEALRLHDDIWKWRGNVDELLRKWFECENYPNEPLLDVVKRLRSSGTQVYLATQQEKYRKSYLEEVIFKDKVDGIFCSCDIGYGKHDNHFWEAVLYEIKKIDSDIEPADIVYFDDKQSLVDLARDHGIATFLYENPDHVQNEVFAQSL